MSKQIIIEKVIFQLICRTKHTPTSRETHKQTRFIKILIKSCTKCGVIFIQLHADA